MAEENKEDIVTWKEIQERHKEVPKENLYKLVLVCKNCGHKDLLINFLKKDELRYNRPARVWPEDNPNIKPWKGVPYKYRSNPGKGMSTKMLHVLDFASVEEYFFCPKCKSSLVALSSEYSKNNLMKVL